MTTTIEAKHETSRGHFKIEITEKEKETRDAYNDIRFKFSINVKNIDSPSWNIQFADTRGRIKNIEDKEKLVEKLIDEIKIRINQDEQGDFYIGEPTLDIT